ncbi:hypothetical protein LCGC14_2043760, partial [marine sediment metagenome]
NMTYKDPLPIGTKVTVRGIPYEVLKIKNDNIVTAKHLETGDTVVFTKGHIDGILK